MTAVSEAIRGRIREKGPIGFDEFMRMALYDPRGGYYAAGAPVIGRGGDFYTSVSVGDVFGRLLVELHLEIWKRLGSPERFAVIEQGAGDGQLAEDVLAAAEKRHPGLAETMRYIIAEPIAELRKNQEQKLLEKWGPRVSWISALKELRDVEGVFFSNECLDAFPFKRVCYEGGRWREMRVALEGGSSFCWEKQFLAAEELEAESPLLKGDFPEGYTTEIRPAVSEWVRSLSATMRRGLALIVDYGFPEAEYFDRERRDGTLRCFREHRASDDPLAGAGEQDISAHVNFTRVVRTAHECGLELAGFTDQHHFLVGAGANVLREMEGRPDSRFVRQFQTLTHPGLMGRAFKVLGLERGLSIEVGPLKGFEHPEPVGACGVSES